MKQLWFIIIGATVLFTLIVLGFAVRQVERERASLTSDMEYRTRLLGESFTESIEPNYLNSSHESIQKILDKFANRRRLVGLAVFDNKGEIIASSERLAATVTNSWVITSQAMDSDKSIGEFLSINNEKIYFFVQPLHQETAVVGALVVVQKADYIDAAVRETWKETLVRSSMQVLLFFLVAFLILRLLIFKPIIAMVETIQRARLGAIGQSSAGVKSLSFFAPLTKEISKLSESLTKARSAASEEARMRLEELDSPWTEERLKEFIKAYYKDRTIVVVSNREPYIHHTTNHGTEYSVPASGMVTAIEPVMEACGGLWIAQATGDADRQTVNTEGKIAVPPDEPKYTLQRVWLSDSEEKGFYIGFSNEALWPLCHNAHTRPIFRKEDWLEYRRVNGKFAQTLLSEIKGVARPIILVQDFHFALLPQMIKRSRPDAQVGIFWHVPWPNAERFSICPWRKELLEGLLGADVIGFHTQQYCNNFMDTVGREIESLVDIEQFTVTIEGHVTSIKPFPISIAFPGSQPETTVAEGNNALERFGITTKYVGLGVDRLDYTKGILERFKAIEFFLTLHPSYKGKFTFLQISPPSREGVEKYRQFNEEVSTEAERINKILGRGVWKPIVLMKEHMTHAQLQPLYRRANICLVTPLHDGMNLVAKEFVAARSDEAGVLILSQFAGASRDLKAALIVNPYSAEQTASAIHEGLIMSFSQQHVRMKKLREVVRNYNVYRWSAEFIRSVGSAV